MKRLSKQDIERAYRADDHVRHQKRKPQNKTPKEVRQTAEPVPRFKGALPMIRQDEGSVPVRIWTDKLDAAAWRQLSNLAGLPILHPSGVAVMPDVHVGNGACVGSVIPTRGALVPSAVGLDAGCGMVAVKLDLRANQLPDSLRQLRLAIEAAVPLGTGGIHDEVADPDTWAALEPGYKKILSSNPGLFKKTAPLQLGTLGAGNHFIEVCLDETSHVWVMIHSGSRGIGNMIGQHFINKAFRRTQEEGIVLADRGLGWLPEGTPVFDEYEHALLWAQDYARENRKIMLARTLSALRGVLDKPVRILGEAVNCFAGETPVITKQGTRPIKELAGGTHEILTENGKWVMAPFSSFGKQALSKITLSRKGVKKILHATSNHGWIIAPQQRKFTIEKTTSQLLPGDRLACSFPNKTQELQINEKGIARGFVFGDGSMSSKNKARANFCGAKDAQLMPLFTKGGWGLNPRVYPKMSVINGLPGAWKKELPGLEDDHDLLYGWLAGYFAADGDVDKTGRPTLTSSRRENLEFVRILCSRLGIGTFGIRENVRSGFEGKISSLFMLGLMRKDLTEDFFLIKEHRERYTSTIEKVSERRHWAVVSVEQTDRFEEVYCATVEHHHCFTLEDNILTRNCHHNYAVREKHFGEDLWITRKGAIRAGVGEWGVIPGSMGAQSFIVRGKGVSGSYCSCSHGAGRVMSRSRARDTFTTADLKKQTTGIECRKDRAVVDEIPGAYKDIRTVMSHQSDLVEIVHTLHQVVCVKGA